VGRGIPAGSESEGDAMSYYLQPPDGSPPDYWHQWEPASLGITNLTIRLAVEMALQMAAARMSLRDKMLAQICMESTRNLNDQ